MGATLQSDFTPIIDPDILPGFTNAQNDVVLAKMLSRRIVEIDISEAGSSIIDMEKLDLVFMAKPKNLLTKLGDLTAPIQALGLYQQLELPIGNRLMQFHGNLFNLERDYHQTLNTPQARTFLAALARANNQDCEPEQVA